MSGREAVCRHQAFASEHRRMRHRGNAGLSVIEGGPEVAVPARDVFVFGLQLGEAGMLLGGSQLFLGRGLRRRSASPAIEADIIHGRMIERHLLVVGVVNAGRVHVVDGRVVDEGTVVPIAATIAFAEVPKAVVNPAIKAQVRAPISGMPDVIAVAPAPIARRPKVPMTGASTQVPGTQ